MFWRVLNAADFGLPQNRQRLFIVGLKPHLALTLWQWPTGTHATLPLLKELLGDQYWENHEVSRKVKGARTRWDR